MTDHLRVIDSGVVEGRMNIAIGHALIESHHEGKSPDTLRFLRFPPTALVGRHQALNQEVDTAYCSAHGVGLARRITGGGAIYLDPGQLGWELVIRRSALGKDTLTDLARHICETAAEAISHFGVAAAFRPRNDIEVNGRKIGGTGGFFDGDTLFYQGTVLVDLDPQTMVAALRVPRAKLAKRDLDSAAQRVVTLKELLGDECPDLAHLQDALATAFATKFGLEARPSGLSEAEKAMAQSMFDEEIGRDEFVTEIDEPGFAGGILEGEHTGPGGTIRSYVTLQGPARNRLGSVLITGDFFVAPPRVVYDLEGALRGIYIDDIGKTLDCFFKRTPTEVLSVGRDDFAASLQAALGLATGSKEAPE